MNFNKEQVKDFLPHRDPFLFIDSVDYVTTESSKIESSKDLVGSKVKARFKVSKNMMILQGHFPGNPILPGVVQVEIMAQACAFTSMPLTKNRGEDLEVETLLLGVEKSRFRKQVTPECELEIYTEMMKVRSNIASYECEIHCNGEKVSEASILARLIIKDKNE